MTTDKIKNIDIEERAAQGVENFKKGFNCSQAVMATFADVYNLGDEFLSMASSFGGGMGRLRMTCGACSGMFMLAGLQTGSADATDLGSRNLNYATVQMLGKKFLEENGSMICSELLGLRTNTIEPPVPSTRDAAYYRNRPCSKMVESACRIYAEYLKELADSKNQ